MNASETPNVCATPTAPPTSQSAPMTTTTIPTSSNAKSRAIVPRERPTTGVAYSSANSACTLWLSRRADTISTAV